MAFPEVSSKITSLSQAEESKKKLTAELNVASRFFNLEIAICEETIQDCNTLKKKVDCSDFESKILIYMITFQKFTKAYFDKDLFILTEKDFKENLTQFLLNPPSVSLVHKHFSNKLKDRIYKIQMTIDDAINHFSKIYKICYDINKIMLNPKHQIKDVDMLLEDKLALSCEMNESLMNIIISLR